MGHNGNHIKLTGSDILFRLLNGGNPSGDKSRPTTDEDTPKYLKLNAPQLFDKKWNDTQAAGRRDDLNAQLPVEQNNPTFGRDSSLQNQTEQAKNLLNQAWNDLVNLAAQHKDLGNFHDQGVEFWDKVVKMSDLSVVETHVNGKLEPRVTSRYGDLLDLLNKNGGGQQIEHFLNSLPTAEKEVFQARFQIGQTFGANELFAGPGIALDKNGRFPLQIFLSSNGKNPQMSANTILGWLGGDATANKAAAILEQPEFLGNYQFLFNSKSAALLSLSLALYQNVNALLSLNELTPEAFLSKTLNQPAVSPEQPRLTTKNTFGTTEIVADAAAKRAAGAMFAAGALINGALLTIEKYQKARRLSARFSADAELKGNFRFAAGATGAMMGATVGCVAPLAEKSFGEILGFATSVVVGLTDTGLSSLGANALVSVITSGVQNFLNISSDNQKSLPHGAAQKFLNGADIFENDLRKMNFKHADTFSPA